MYVLLMANINLSKYLWIIIIFQKHHKFARISRRSFSYNIAPTSAQAGGLQSRSAMNEQHRVNTVASQGYGPAGRQYSWHTWKCNKGRRIVQIWNVLKYIMMLLNPLPLNTYYISIIVSSYLEPICTILEY